MAHRFRVGDKVVGNKINTYYQTRQGWVGEVMKTDNNFIWVWAKDLRETSKDRGFMVRPEMFDSLTPPFNPKLPTRLRSGVPVTINVRKSKTLPYTGTVKLRKHTFNLEWDKHGRFCPHGETQFDLVNPNATHMNKMEDSHYVNVCVEHTNFAPVHVDEIWAQTRKLL